MKFLISERGEKVTGRERLDTDNRILRAQVYTSSRLQNIKNTFTPPKHTRRMCMIVSDCVCVRLLKKRVGTKYVSLWAG
jgi:hypothetical protein